MKQKVSPAVMIPLFVGIALILAFSVWKVFLAPSSASGVNVDAAKARIQKEINEEKGEKR